MYAEWCGPCKCLAQTYKRILMDNDAILEAAKEENKTIKFWTVCSGAKPAQAPAQAPARAHAHSI